MATIQINNLTGGVVNIADIGVQLAPLASQSFSDADFIRMAATSANLATLIGGGSVSLTDGLTVITQASLLGYWDRPGFQPYPTSLVFLNDRWWYIQQNPGLTTLDQFGFSTAPTITGGASVVNGTIAQFISYLSAAVLNSEAGWVSTAFTQTRRDFRPIYSAVVQLGATLTNVRHWCGMFSANPSTSDVPVVHGFGFRYSTTSDGTAFWRCWTNDGVGGGTAIVTNVPIIASTAYLLTIMVNEANTTILFFINGALVATQTVDIPSNGVDMGHVERVTTLDAVAKSIAISRVALRQRAA